MRDVILVTADSVRYDFLDAMDYVSGFDRHRGITAGHYTRPSLAGLLSASYRGAIESRAVSPTVASAFSEAGYTTIGLSSSPHTDPRFGFDAGFDVYEYYDDAGTRGNPLRQFASRFDLIRRLYHRVRPPHVKLSSRLPDAELIDNAVAAFDDQSGPRFMWLHLMGTHRPYGRGTMPSPGRSIGRPCSIPARWLMPSRRRSKRRTGPPSPELTRKSSDSSRRSMRSIRSWCSPLITATSSARRDTTSTSHSAAAWLTR
jgi:hypothetical protein